MRGLLALWTGRQVVYLYCMGVDGIFLFLGDPIITSVLGGSVSSSESAGATGSGVAAMEISGCRLRLYIKL